MSEYKQTIIVKNLKTYNILIEDLGIEIPQNSSINLTDSFDDYVILGSKDLYQLVYSQELIINDGINDLAVDVARDFLTIETIRNDVANDTKFAQWKPSISQDINTINGITLNLSSTIYNDIDVYTIINNNTIRVLQDGWYEIVFNVNSIDDCGNNTVVDAFIVKDGVYVNKSSEYYRRGKCNIRGVHMLYLASLEQFNILLKRGDGAVFTSPINTDYTLCYVTIKRIR